jgi:hypothetical protein
MEMKTQLKQGCEDQCDDYVRRYGKSIFWLKHAPQEEAWKGISPTQKGHCAKPAVNIMLCGKGPKISF